MNRSLPLLVLLMAAVSPAWAQQAPAAKAVLGDAYWTPPAPGSVAAPTSIDGVMSDAVFGAKGKGINAIESVRATAIQESAAAYGAQAGMAARGNQLNAAIRARHMVYGRAFDFSVVMLEPGFLPPVITEGRDAYNQPNDNEVRAADRIYKIEFPARLVNTPPLAMDYLMVPVSSATPPDRTVLPRNSEEKALWDQWASQGWNQGVALADDVFSANLARLRRDFEGMLRYKMLYQQGVVSKPILARSNLGVTGGGDEMAIGDRIFRITAKAQLDPNTGRWSTPMPTTHPSDAPASNKP